MKSLGWARSRHIAARQRQLTSGGKVPVIHTGPCTPDPAVGVRGCNYPLFAFRAAGPDVHMFLVDTN